MPDAGRVVTGTAKGVRLLAPGRGTRPLADRVKQALFSAVEAELADDWPGPFLDLFAGSGAGGIEALSRGATRAVFVERDPDTARVLAQNLRRAGVSPGRVIRGDAITVLGRGAEAAGGPFMAVLVDPPYGEALLLDAALRLLGGSGHGWLAPGAVVVAKHFWRDDPLVRAGKLRRVRQRRFGETMLSYYRVDDAMEAPPA